MSIIVDPGDRRCRPTDDGIHPTQPTPDSVRDRTIQTSRLLSNPGRPLKYRRWCAAGNSLGPHFKAARARLLRRYLTANEPNGSRAMTPVRGSLHTYRRVLDCQDIKRY